MTTQLRKMAMLLGEVLDQIHSSGERRAAVASRAAGKFDRTDVLFVSTFELASLFETVPIRFSIDSAGQVGELQFPNRKIDVYCVDQVENSTIYYSDRRLGIYARDKTLNIVTPNFRGLAEYLTALQFARDHVDSILFLPSDLREQKIKNIADASKRDVKEIRFLLANFNSIGAALRV